MPDCPLSNGVNRWLPFRGPVSLTVFMSHTPLLGSPSASCSSTEAIERCWNSGLPKVIGVASVAVGPAELGRGVKSEKRVSPAAMAPEDAMTVARMRLLAAAMPRMGRFMIGPFRIRSAARSGRTS